MPPPSRNVAILGTGLIGGSLGLALHERRPDLNVVGYDLPEVAERAVEVGAVHRAAPTPAEAVEAADLVVLATPPAAALVLLAEVAPHLRAGAVVTDVGSVKRPIVQHARKVLPQANPFIGGHPMAGAERGGIEHADPLLFENAAWVLCPQQAGVAAPLENALSLLIELVSATGARPVLLDADRHDRIVAAVSHLPQLLAVALVNEVEQADEQARTLAAGGFRDMTRIASSPFDLWREILVGNNGPVLDVLARFSDRLQRLRYAVAAEDWEALATAFDDAAQTRAAIPPRSKGFLNPLAELTVHAEDRPGYLLGVLRVLAEAHINVKDVELLKVREGTDGVFRLGFAGEADAARAFDALTDAGYRARRRE